MSVSHDDDNFDFNKLERELRTAVEADEKYTRENDAKIRAVHQKVASYDEFREIVMASHLKPLEKGDKIEGKFAQPWNMHADKLKHKEQQSETEIKQTSAKLPKNGQEFVREWRKLPTEKRCNYLFDFGAEKLESVFKPEISFGLLGEFLCALRDYAGEDYSSLVGILEALSSTNRFTLSVQFLSSKEKEACEQLFSELDSAISLADRITPLKKVYGLMK